MKARKRRIAVVMAVMLAFALVTVNAVPVLADEVVRQSMEEKAENAEHAEIPENSEAEGNAELTGNTERTEDTEASVPAANPITEVTGWNKHEPNNELVISQDQLGGSIIAGKMTANQPVVIWTHTPLSEEGRKLVWDSLKGNPGVGNPKNVVFIDGSTASLYGMTVDSEKGIVRFDKTSNWSLLYAGEYKTAGPSVDPGQEDLPGTGEEPGTDEEPGTGAGPILDGGPDTEPKTDIEESPEVPGPGTDVETEPEIKQEPEKLPETEDKHDTEVKPETEPEAKPEDKPETKPEVKPENVQNSLRPSGTSSDSSGSSGSGSGRSRSYGSNSSGPGAVHALDAQPDTGLLSEVRGRQLDETPKTGVPAEFCILMVISVLSLIALGITLIFEKKSEKGKNE